MDYDTLAEELLHHMQNNSKLKYQRETEDFTHGEMSILSYLYFKKDGICSGSLCKSLSMTTPRISAAISGLCRKGYISKSTDNGDRRRVHIYITDSGKKLVEDRHDKLLKNLTNVLKALGEDDAREYVRIVERIAYTIHD